MIAGLEKQPKKILLQGRTVNNSTFIRRVKGGNANLLTVELQSGKQPVKLELIW